MICFFYFRLYQIRVNLRKFLLLKTVRKYLTWSRENTGDYQNKPKSHYIVQILWTFSVSSLAQLAERSTLTFKYPRSISSPRKIFDFLLRTFLSIEHNLSLSMILMGEPLANYVKSLDSRYALVSEGRTKTGNELLHHDLRQSS